MAKNVVSSKDIKNRIKQNIGKNGLKVQRVFTKEDNDPYAGIDFELRTSKISNTDGSTVFEMNNVEVPSTWSQVATDILAQKYFRKAGVPQYDEDGDELLDKDGDPVLGSETKATQAVDRLAETWRHWGEKYDYFETEDDAQAFEDELKYMIIRQMVAPNSPQWFNTGLAHKYGITGTAQGHWYVDPEDGKAKLSEDSYTHPQVHACFIQGISDDLVNPGGIMDLVTREARVFKFGSGTGSNFSNLRAEGEKLSGGGTSSGMMSFLNIFDAAAGSIKSGGTTRRAAKMVSIDIDHPEIEKFINWKVIEEQKVASLVAGSYVSEKYIKQIMRSAEEKGTDPAKNPELKGIIREAKENFVSLNYIKRSLMLVENGVKADEFEYRTFDTDFRSEAYATVGGQNANNSVRVTNEFLEAVENDEDWDLTARTTGEAMKTVKARDLWNQIAIAAWQSADPGLQYHSTINEWHTCINDGEINASNPCSEYMFLNDTACNLASFNLKKFYDAEEQEFMVEEFRHAVRLLTIVLEISILMSHLPSEDMATRTHQYRTLGLGYANLGAMLMTQGVPYESEEGYAITGAISAILTGEAYATSAEMAATIGQFERYEENEDSMLRVIRNHRLAAYNAAKDEYDNLTITPMGINHEEIEQEDLSEAAKAAWDYALELGEKYGYRNAQATAIAPTGTIGLVMDCDTTGCEPDFALVKFKKLVGGGYFKLVNSSVKPALDALGYSKDEIEEIEHYIVGHQTLTGAPHINPVSLKEKGFTTEQLEAIEVSLPSLFELKYAFTKWTLGEDFCKEVLGLNEDELNDPSLNILEKIGFSDSQIAEAEEYVCGNMTIEGAPNMKDEDYAVFDCANKNGKNGQRFISAKGHIYQMAAAQPFISGAISKTINLPEEASVEDVENAYMLSWEMMLKANALYRDGSKLSQPLSTSSLDSAYAELFMFDEEEQVNEQASAKELQKTLVAHQEQLKPQRRKLPSERHSITHKFDVAGTEGYITVGLFEDGQPGEVFITMNKAGSTLNGIMDAYAISLSMNLQYGVPLEALIRKFTHTRFEPAGMTSNREIPMAKSIIDYLFRWMAVRFLAAEQAKQYHNPELVEMSYSSGTNSRVYIPYINGKGHTELKMDGLNQHIQDLAKDLDRSTASSAAREEMTVQVAANSYSPASAPGAATAAELTKSQAQLAAQANDSDAPLCTECGSVTFRQGSCYYCRNCGASTGCS